MHQQIVARGAAVDAQFDERVACVFLHGLEHVGRLQSDRFQRRARQMCARRAAREADDQSARSGIPIRRAQARERRHELNAARIRHRPRQRFDFGRVANDAEAIAQPLHDRTTDKYAAFQAERTLTVGKPPTDGRQQSIL